MKELGAVFGSVYGWERPNWFAPPATRLSEADLAKPDVLLNENHPAVAPGERPREKWSFRRSNYFEFVGAECRNVHENVGLHGHVGLRQMRGLRSRRRRLARFHPHQPRPEGGRPRHADLSARPSAAACAPNSR